MERKHKLKGEFDPDIEHDAYFYESGHVWNETRGERYYVQKMLL